MRFDVHDWVSKIFAWVAASSRWRFQTHLADVALPNLDQLRPLSIEFQSGSIARALDHARGLNLAELDRRAELADLRSRSRVVQADCLSGTCSHTGSQCPSRQCEQTHLFICLVFFNSAPSLPNV